MAAALNLGLVGLGDMGWRHVEALLRIPGVRVPAVADLRSEVLENAERTWGVRTYDSWEQLLDSERIDGLVISTPPAAHAAPALAAMTRGLAVFIEKPLARRLPDARRLVQVARDTGAVAAIGYQWRAIDFLGDVKDALTMERVGLLCGRSIGQSTAPDWMVDWEQGGGILLELASHDIDLQRALAGEVVSAQAAKADIPLADGIEPGVASVLTITLQFRSGALGAVQVAWLADGLPPYWGLDVVTDQSVYYIALDPTFALTGTGQGRRLDRPAASSPRQDNLVRFVDATRTNDPAAVFSNVEDAARTLAVCLACDEALTTGSTVPVDETAVL